LTFMLYVLNTRQGTKILDNLLTLCD